MAKVLVSLGDALLRRIDRVARARGLSRSAYLAELAERDALVGTSPAGESTELVRAERDAR
jgi:metal-responsive CopG/Arc/MetJ family transcriptional regulator